MSGPKTLTRLSAIEGHPLWVDRGSSTSTFGSTSMSASAQPGSSLVHTAAARVTIAVAAPRALLQVSAFAQDLDAAAQSLSGELKIELPAPTRMTVSDGLSVRAIGPGIWHVAGDEARVPSGGALAAAAGWRRHRRRPGHARTVFHVSGPDAARTIAKHCGLDLDPRVFPPGSATGTRFNQLGMTLARIDGSDTPLYELSVFRGYAVFVFESLVESAREFGVALR